MDKDNMIINAKKIAKKLGGRIIVYMKKGNRMISMENKEGQKCLVWFPFGQRCNDMERKDFIESFQFIFDKIL